MTHIGFEYFLPARRNPLHTSVRYDYLTPRPASLGPGNYLQGTAVPIKHILNSNVHDRERNRHFSDLHRSIFSLPEIASQSSSFSPTLQTNRESVRNHSKLSSTSRSFPPRTDISRFQLGNCCDRVTNQNSKHNHHDSFPNRLLNVERDRTNNKVHFPDVWSSVEDVISDDSESEKESDNITIHAFPNVGSNSALSSEIISLTFSPNRKSTSSTKKSKNPQLRKKQNDIKKEEVKPKTTRKPRREGGPRRKRVNYAMVRKHDQENARRHPVRKQIFYSEALTVKLQKLIPKRITGGKLKPTLQRTPDGEIFVPSSPLEVRLDTLVSTDSADPSPPPEAIRWRENLNKLTNEGKKHKKKVRFRLPAEMMGEDRPAERRHVVRDEETGERIVEEDFHSSESSPLQNEEVKNVSEENESQQSSEGCGSLVDQDVTLPNIFKTESDRNGIKRTNIDSVMYVDRKDARKLSQTNFQDLTKKVENLSVA